MYVCMYETIYIYIYIYIYIHMLSSSRKSSGHFLMVSVVDIIQHFFFLWFPSLVFLNGFRRGRERFLFGLRRFFSFFFCHGFRRGGTILFYGFRSCNSKRGLRRAGGGMPPIRHKLATALRTRRRAVMVASSCAGQRPRILT